MLRIVPYYSRHSINIGHCDWCENKSLLASSSCPTLLYTRIYNTQKRTMELLSKICLNPHSHCSGFMTSPHIILTKWHYFFFHNQLRIHLSNACQNFCMVQLNFQILRHTPHIPIPICSSWMLSNLSSFLRKGLFFIKNFGSYFLLYNVALLIISRSSPVLHSLQTYPALKSLITDHTILLIFFPPWSIHPRLICVFCQSPYRQNCFSINVRPPPTHWFIKKKKKRNPPILQRMPLRKVVNHHMLVLNCIVLHCIMLLDCKLHRAESLFAMPWLLFSAVHTDGTIEKTNNGFFHIFLF